MTHSPHKRRDATLPIVSQTSLYFLGFFSSSPTNVTIIPVFKSLRRVRDTLVITSAVAWHMQSCSIRSRTIFKAFFLHQLLLFVCHLVRLAEPPQLTSTYADSSHIFGRHQCARRGLTSHFCESIWEVSGCFWLSTEEKKASF